MSVDGRWSDGSQLRSWLLTGAAVSVPLLITALVLGLAASFISDLLDPIVTAVEVVPGISPVVGGILVQVLAVGVLFLLFVAVGAGAQYTEKTYAPRVHAAIESVPGIGDLYRSFHRMSDVFVDNNTETFQEVKLIEFPQDGCYSVAFVTADTPAVVEATAGQMQMQTLFVPLSPNPVMGGFLVHLSPDRIHDVDMTVEEAVQSIVTSGVSVEATERTRERPFTIDELSEMDMDAIDESLSNDPADRD